MPSFIGLADLGRHPLIDCLYLSLGLGLGAFSMAPFAQWHWVA